MRELINQSLLSLIDSEKVGLLFSGGTDSTCLLFSLLELGYSPTLYTYHLDGYDSPDLERAQFVSSTFGLPLVVCTIPNSIESLIADVQRMLRDGVHGKVAIQCLHGHYYIAPVVKEPILINGSGVDGLYGVYVTFERDGSHSNKEKFDTRRVCKHLQNPNDDAMQYQTVLYAHYGVRVAYPYRDKNITDFLMSQSWTEINTPVWKWITVKDYWQDFQRFDGYFRKRGSQQIVAGTRAFHDQLLDTELNKKQRKSVADLYKDMAENSY